MTPQPVNTSRTNESLDVLKRITRPKNLFAAASTIGIAALLVFAQPALAGTGNGAPTGPHFNLNIIGVSNTTNFSASCGGGGNVIFVPLFGHANIFLQQGPFYVVDGNGVTPGCKAQFQLPAPLTATGAQAYEVWARVEGIPGGSGHITTCGTDITDGALVCSTGTTITTRELKNHFTDISSTLLQVCGTIAGVFQCVPLFSSSLTTFFWSYDNSGNKVLQLRFYPCPTSTGTC